MNEGDRSDPSLVPSFPSTVSSVSSTLSEIGKYLYINISEIIYGEEQQQFPGAGQQQQQQQQHHYYQETKPFSSPLAPIDEDSIQDDSVNDHSAVDYYQAMNGIEPYQEGANMGEDDSEEIKPYTHSEREGSFSMGQMDIEDDIEIDLVKRIEAHAKSKGRGSGSGTGSRKNSMNGSFSTTSTRTKLVDNRSSQAGNGPDNLSNMVQDLTGSNGEILDLSEFMDPLQASLKDLSPDLLEKIGNPTIEEDTPAAAAIRANAEVRVGRISKMARGVNAQAVRKVVKRATLRRKFGSVRGKPPRVPPPQFQADDDFFLCDRDSSSSGDEDWKSCRSTSFSVTGAEFLEQNSGRSANSARSGRSQKSSGSHSDRIASQPHVSFGDVHVIKPPSSHRLVFEETPSKPSSLNSTGTGKFLPHEMGEIRSEVLAGTLEASDKVMGHVDPHDILKLKRKNKKKAKKERKSYVKGKVINAQHELYTQSIAVMLGVRTSIANLNAQIHANSNTKRRILYPADFASTEKYEFRPKGSPKTPPHQLTHTFKFKDYAPVVFAYLRRLFGVNEYDFLLSVCGNANFIEFISNAKSGQFFFYSNDGKYMIKTMTDAESKFLRRILPGYFRHCVQNPNTLLTKFLGMYRVKLYHLRKNVKFVIMNSVYYTDKYLHSFYDLKGSVIGRDARPGEDVKKDNDLRRTLPDDSLAMAPDVRERVRAQVVSDCSFLRSAGIMDYSMLVGVHYIPVHHSNRSLNKPRSTKKTNQKEPFFVPNESFRRKSHRSVNSGIETFEACAPPSTVYDDLLDEDDISYIEGSDQRPQISPSSLNPEAEKKKRQTIERIFWPFHGLYDLHGHRIKKPRKCVSCGATQCSCSSDIETDLGPFFKGLPKFTAPLSVRKDGGLLMDTTGHDLPKKFVTPRGEFLYEGKIFYMGIIDILQEYNSRKKVEASYRLWQTRSAPVKGEFEQYGSGQMSPASCVSPDIYAKRFVMFFDEYTEGLYKPADQVIRKTEDVGVEVSMQQQHA